MQWQLNGDGWWMAMDGNGQHNGDLMAMDLTEMYGVMATGGQQWTDWRQWTAMDGSSTAMDDATATRRRWTARRPLNGNGLNGNGRQGNAQR
jgi:hypothetical protein